MPLRSLTAKLVLAFLVASIAGVVLAAIFIRQFVAQQFNDVVLGQHRAAFIAKAGSYYAERGTWEGVGPWLHDHPPEDAPSPARPGAQAAPQPRASGFVLLDQTGRVMIPFGRYNPNELVSPADQAHGTPVTINGQTVGTVLTIELTARDPAVAQYLAQTDGALAAAGLGVIAIALLLGGLLARRITRPLRELTVAAGAHRGGRPGAAGAGALPRRAGDARHPV